MVLMPPGSAKSTYTSVIFPPWWLSQHPGASIICASHSYNLAAHFSRRVRALITEHAEGLGYNVDPGQRAVDAWRTSNDSEYLAVGVRGAIAGRRADLVIIDDPIRSQAEADSVRQREYVWDWYKSDLTTRLKPGGKIILIMTRWHPDDLGGHLIEHSRAEWKILRLPALAEPGDPLGRPVGAALWPEWEDQDALLRKRDLIGERAWSALFQQVPLPAGGRLFQVDRITVVPRDDDGEILVRAWDLAATADTGRHDPDWTVGVKLSRTRAGRFVVVDVARLRGTPHQVEELIIGTARRDGARVLVAIPEDPGQAGKSQSAYLTRQLAGFHVIAARETGSKAVRAVPLASQIEAGNLSVVGGHWNTTLLEELQDFPWGHKDDQVDALVRAFSTLTARPRVPASPSLSFLDR